MRIGIFGGTFNPVHLGHVDMMNQVLDRFHLDKIIFIPAYIPPHKQNCDICSFEDRFAMLSIAIEGQPRYEISRYERQSDRPSYTYYTIQHFHQLYPNDDFFYIMGADSMNSIESWHRWDELLMMCHLIVIDRNDYKVTLNKNVKRILKESPYEYEHLRIKTLPISSTQIRDALKNHQDMTNFLDAKVLDYIMENHLYGT